MYALDEQNHCAALTGPTGEDYFAIGAAIPASALAPAWTMEGGAGRLRLRYDMGPGGAHIPSRLATLDDTTRDEMCTVTRLSDAVAACLPFSDAVIVGFADATCSSYLVAYYPPADGGSALPRTVVFAVDADGSPGTGDTLRAFTVGAKLDAQTSYVKDYRGKCMPYPVALSREMYALGPEVSLDAFAHAPLAHD